MTCGYLVFCIPSAPKAFSKFGIPTRIASALHSWKGRLSSLGKGSADKRSDSGEQIHGHRLNSLGAGFDSYQEFPKTQDTFPKDSFNTRTSFESAERLPGWDNPPAGGIVMTTQTVTTLQRSDQNTTAEEHGLQHPWTLERL